MENQLISLKEKYGKYTLAFIAMCFSFMFLYPSLNNGFVNWDDMSYVENNELLTELSGENIKEMFTGLQFVGTYSPLTLLSWAVDYSLGGLNPWIFHFTNLLLHLFNVLLVFVLMLKLSSRNDIALFCALIFGVHPMNIEVVAWVSARKDVLYTFFFLFSLISYLNFSSKKEKKIKWYVLCLALFSCSLLSKGMAITLPFVLLLIDFLKGKKRIKKLILEKIPFVVVALIFGVVGMLAQQDSGAMKDLREINFLEGFFVACHNLIYFLVKLFVPVNLSAFHSYPNAIGLSLPWYFYASILPVLLLSFTVYKWGRKNKLIVFGVLFFLITISPVIQFLPFGTALLSERYVYVPYLGLYLILAIGLSAISLKLDQYAVYLKKPLGLSIVVVLIIFGVLSHQRIAVWKDGLSLWSDVINKYPKEKIGYSNRSEFLRDNLMYDEAIKDIKTAIICDPNFSQGYNLLAFLYLKLNQNKKALLLLNKSLSISNEYAGAHVNRAIAYSNLGQLELALKDFNMVIANGEEHYNHYLNRANLYVQMKQYENALVDFDKTIEVGGDDIPLVYRERGRALFLLNRNKEALNDFNRCIDISTNDLECYYLRGLLLMREQVFAKALDDFTSVIALKQNHTDAILNRGVVNMNIGKYQEALNDFDQSETLKPQWSLVYLNKGLLYYKVEQYELALAQFNKGIALYPEMAKLYSFRAQVYSKLNKIDLEKLDLIKAKELE